MSKRLGRVADHHLGLVHRVHVEEHESLPQVILRARRADGSDRRAHDRDRLAAHALSPYGREAQSIAFLSTPGTE